MTKPTALITGASDGIGLEFAKILAARGYNLVLVARREALLNDLGASLKANYPIDYWVIAADLSQPKAAQAVFQETQEKNLTVDLLINNAGLLHNGFFTDIDVSAQERMMTVNMLALTSLTHLCANDMASRGHGHILNVSSLAAWMPIPNQNVYAATKAYVLAFSQALADELKASNTGISVSALCPGYTATKMMDNPDQGGKLAIATNMMMSPQAVAEIGLQGCLAGRSVIVPGLSNKITTGIVRLFSKTLITKLVGIFYRKNMQ